RSCEADLGAGVPRAVGARPRRRRGNERGELRRGHAGKSRVTLKRAGPVHVASCFRVFVGDAASAMRVTMLVRCLAMMRGGGETRHLAWARELTALGVDVDIITGRPLVARPRFRVDGAITVLRSPYARDFVYRFQRKRGFGRLTMLALHLD